MTGTKQFYQQILAICVCGDTIASLFKTVLACQGDSWKNAPCLWSCQNGTDFCVYAEMYLSCLIQP